jgi:hypothetical protein
MYLMLIQQIKPPTPPWRSHLEGSQVAYLRLNYSMNPSQGESVLTNGDMCVTLYALFGVLSDTELRESPKVNLQPSRGRRHICICGFF